LAEGIEIATITPFFRQVPALMIWPKVDFSALFLVSGIIFFAAVGMDVTNQPLPQFTACGNLNTAKQKGMGFCGETWQNRTAILPKKYSGDSILR
jgi:hypothetical protein